MNSIKNMRMELLWSYSWTIPTMKQFFVWFTIIFAEWLTLCCQQLFRITKRDHPKWHQHSTMFQWHFSSTSLCKNLEFMLTASDDFRLQKSDITKAVLFQLGWMDLIKSWEISSAATQKHFQINSRNLCKHKNYNMLLLCEKNLMSRLKSNNNISDLWCVSFDAI